jgi:hypothetical protein
MARWFLATALTLSVGLSSTALGQHVVHSSAANTVQGIELAPGEILVSVNGVPVSSQQQAAVRVSNTTPTTHASPRSSARVIGGTVQRTAAEPASAELPRSTRRAATSAPQGTSRNGLIVNRDPQAYAHALREAQILASRGEGYHRYGDGGHPLGVAPGCRYAGTGYSRDPNRPHHCYQGELPESRLVARAMVPGPNGTYFWSAHYR